MTVVYTIGKGSSWGDNELRYSIRSMVMFTSVSRIIIVGHKPAWCVNVDHIAVKDGPRKNYNIHLKTLAACDATDEFIQAADDHFVLQPTDFSTYYHSGPINEKRYTGNYATVTANTSKVLPGGLFYNLHIPMKMNSEAYKQIMSRYDWTKKEYLVKSLYANNIGVVGVRSKDCKVRESMRLDKIKNYVKDRGFLSVGDSGLSMDMKRFLKQTFPERSRYENSDPL